MIFKFEFEDKFKKEDYFDLEKSLGLDREEIEKSRKKPAGHKAYQRTTKTGKVAQIKEKPYTKKVELKEKVTNKFAKQIAGILTDNIVADGFNAGYSLKEVMNDINNIDISEDAEEFFEKLGISNNEDAQHKYYDKLDGKVKEILRQGAKSGYEMLQDDFEKSRKKPERHQRRLRSGKVISVGSGAKKESKIKFNNLKETGKSFLQEHQLTKVPSRKAIGTSFVSRVEMSYSELVSLLGEPHTLGSADDKVKAQWVFDTPVGIMTIYDYKENTPKEEVTDWHIGGGARKMDIEEFAREIFSSEEVVEIQERIAGLTPADEGTKAIVQESITEENLPKVRGMSFNELKDIIESPVTKDEPEYVDIFRGLAKKELERRRDEFESFKEDAETINTNKVIEVQRLMEKDGISSEYISPNFVAAFAARVGIELTSPEVVEITDTYNYEEEPEDLEKSRVQGAKDKQKRKKRAGIKFGDTVQVVGSSGDWRVLERDAVNSELVLIKQGHTGKMQRIHAGELIKKSVAGCETPEDLEKARTHGAKDKQKRKVKNLKEAIEVYGKNSLEAKKMKELKREKLTQLDDLEKSKKQSRRHVRTRAGKPYWAGQREETPVLEMEPESDIHEAERDTLKRYGIENPVRQGEPAYFCKSRQKPAGHKAYQRTTKTGKVAQIKEKPYAKKEKKSTKKQFDNFIYSQIFDKWDNDKINNITKKLKNTFPKKNKLIDKMIEIAGNASNIRDDFQQEEMEYSQEGTNAKEYNFLNKQLKNEYNQVEKISNQIFNKKK